MKCKTGKKLYKHERTAWLGLIRSREKGQTQNKVYICPYCKHYHLSSQLGEMPYWVKKIIEPEKKVKKKRRKKKTTVSYKDKLQLVAQHNYSNLPWWRKLLLKLK